ncbi:MULTISPECIES: enoyl-CoA hydratase-related protein [Pseudomonas putida group]|uniref:Enoyl-CoA hydratase n=1 Tax=Pseudomonas putida (strain DOT-T1E) TaxID=1196325 RepID=I7BHJ2_PSEPT|nr:enoyl-CoA hydratase-related protein [Pseudomonas putida]AFO51268.1 putative enoyl-CoA hydratase [Pseudomonas putida DOT-T1E]UZM95983.1 2-(1,2-epoxy-1,2-dihydrophenyl)acetyl-CoA isomerase PaaG [Pseudomonas putida DOT-T1E]
MAVNPQVVLLRKAPDYAVITLNRPEKLNACTMPLLEGLKAALDDAIGDPYCRAIVLTGAGRGFCAGQDLNERKPVEGQVPDLGASLIEYYNPIILAIRQTDKPVICAVNGVAAGAGANIALACDIVLAANTATFIQAFARIGLGPDAGGSWLLPRLIGEARARALAMLAEPVDAAQAQAWGMIWEIVAADGLLDRAQALAAELATRPVGSFAAIKQAFLASSGNSLSAQLALEAQLQRRAGHSEDYRIGVSAFLTGEQPVFVGR